MKHHRVLGLNSNTIGGILGVCVLQHDGDLTWLQDGASGHGRDGNDAARRMNDVENLAETSSLIDTIDNYDSALTSCVLHGAELSGEGDHVANDDITFDDGCRFLLFSLNDLLRFITGLGKGVRAEAGGMSGNLGLERHLGTKIRHRQGEKERE